MAKKYKVFLGIGHGGKDPGAVGNGLKEKDVNLDIGVACKSVLVSHGVEVLMSREGDVSENLAQRIKECKAFKPDVAVDVHTNAGAGKGDGAEVYHSFDNKEDDILAKYILEEVGKIGQNSRGLKTKMYKNDDYFGFVRQLKGICPSVLFECAFIDNKKDVKIIDTPAERKEMGVALAKAILRYLCIEYKETKKTNKLPIKKGSTGDLVEKINKFYYDVFPLYGKWLKRNKDNVLGEYFGENSIAWTKEFQKNTDLPVTGIIDSTTFSMLKKYGFKE